MILIRRYNPSPRSVWYMIYYMARYSRGQHETVRKQRVKEVCILYSINYNIDSDYLMETMGNYALSIT